MKVPRVNGWRKKKEMEISVQVKLFEVKVDVFHAMLYRLQVRVKIKCLPRIHSKCRLQFPVNSTRVHFWKLMAFRSRWGDAMCIHKSASGGLPELWLDAGGVTATGDCEMWEMSSVGVGTWGKCYVPTIQRTEIDSIHHWHWTPQNYGEFMFWTSRKKLKKVGTAF